MVLRGVSPRPLSNPPTHKHHPCIPSTLDSQNSIVVVPSNHPIFHSPKMLKKHGSLFHIGERSVLRRAGATCDLLLSARTAEEKPIKLIIKAMPGIQAFIHDKLSANSTPPKVNVNGDATR